MRAAERAGWDHRFAQGHGFIGADAPELRRLAEAIRPRPGARALDVGCGLGTYAAALAALGCDTLAVDWADAAVAATRDRYADLEPRLRTALLDFEDTDAVAATLPRGSFDIVTMRLVLAFMSDKQAATDRVRDLLAPGGVWMVTTPLAHRLPEERRGIGLTSEDVALVTDGWARGEWYDLERAGLRCLLLRS
ncbi:class I SAM-dependent methyltransferase [Streptomyces sp. M41]|uniref:class I SAM-dependent methyltransferase n=1 Tax=Streptomyces sp. M41 TaxID=3059412 RepID=UPI00374DBC27